MNKRELIKVGIIAAITTISVTLPGLLFERGLPVGWAIALLAGFVAVAFLGFIMGNKIGDPH